jgi:hypothetical protein
MHSTCAATLRSPPTRCTQHPTAYTPRTARRIYLFVHPQAGRPTGKGPSGSRPGSRPDSHIEAEDRQAQLAAARLPLLLLLLLRARSAISLDPLLEARRACRRGDACGAALGRPRTHRRRAGAACACARGPCVRARVRGGGTVTAAARARVRVRGPSWGACRGSGGSRPRARAAPPAAAPSAPARSGPPPRCPAPRRPPPPTPMPTRVMPTRFPPGPPEGGFRLP